MDQVKLGEQMFRRGKLVNALGRYLEEERKKEFTADLQKAIDKQGKFPSENLLGNLLKLENIEKEVKKFLRKPKYLDCQGPTNGNGKISFEG